jgi:pimeloyl-ACP methyl ester carboxylesterase
MAPLEGSFRYAGHRIDYDVYGEGDRVLVIVHGLLMNRRMYERLGPELASRGNRVVAVDLLGHGRSDRPEDPRLYNMPAFAEQLVALFDHLELRAPVVGGTSLGANVGLELASRHPERVGALFVEMPVLDNALLGAAMIFTPILMALRFGEPVLRWVAAGARRVPRSNQLLDIGLDWIRQDPEPSRAVLEGILFGRTAPPREERQRLTMPALVVGHPSDPLHPFTDADMLVEEMPGARLVDANSIWEWRVSPSRLDEELARFLEEVYSREPADVTDLHSAEAAS